MEKFRTQSSGILLLIVKDREMFEFLVMLNL